MSERAPTLPATPPGGVMRGALAGAAVLVLLGGAAFYYASSRREAAGPAAGPVTVTITDEGCAPASLTVAAGSPIFAIRNTSDRVVEWEILSGAMVVAERENIAPGMTGTLSPDLAAGQYAITCGLLSNPHGALTVTPAAGAAAAAAPTLAAFVGPLAERQVDLTIGAGAFEAAAGKLADAVESGDLAAAKAAYPAASAAYARIRMAARRFGDLDTAIAAEATYFAGKEQDPAFSGLHRLEYAIYGQGSLAGLAPVADKLVQDAHKLAERLAAAKPDPKSLAADPADLLLAMSEAAIPAGGEPYVGTDLGDFSAALEGVGKSVALLEPLAAKPAPELMATIETELAAARKQLDGLRDPSGGFPPYRGVDASARMALAGDFAALGKSLAELNAKLGLH